ncbi:unnamed protein product [Fusarium graminearum]|nr:unnamed protein product [Fusarium graminearum]
MSSCLQAQFRPQYVIPRVQSHVLRCDYRPKRAVTIRNLESIVHRKKRCEQDRGLDYKENS